MIKPESPKGIEILESRSSKAPTVLPSNKAQTISCYYHRYIFALTRSPGNFLIPLVGAALCGPGAQAGRKNRERAWIFGPIIPACQKERAIFPSKISSQRLCRNYYNILTTFSDGVI